MFRHFPTKQALLQAIMKELLGRLAGQAAELAANGDPATGLFAFFTDLVGQAAEKRTVVELLAEGGIDVSIAGSVQALRDGVGQLLSRAQEAGAVRDDVRLDTVGTADQRVPGRSPGGLGSRPAGPHASCPLRRAAARTAMRLGMAAGGIFGQKRRDNTMPLA